MQQPASCIWRHRGAGHLRRVADGASAAGGIFQHQTGSGGSEAYTWVPIFGSPMYHGTALKRDPRKLENYPYLAKGNVKSNVTKMLLKAPETATSLLHCNRRTAWASARTAAAWMRAGPARRYGFPQFGAPFLGPYCKGILPFGVDCSIPSYLCKVKHKSLLARGYAVI